MKKIAVTMGDAAGIGPEISVKTILDERVRRACSPIIIGSEDVIKAACGKLGVSYDTVDVLDPYPLDAKYFAAAETMAEPGLAAMKYMDEAVSLCLAGNISAFASAPLNKEGMAMAGYDFAGATEYLAHLTGAKEYAMVLFFGPIKMFYATNHLSLREALDSINEEMIVRKISFINQTLMEMGEENKSIAVAAINPHAGENGKMGREEIEILGPALRKAKAKGCLVYGPLPADTLFIKAREGEYGAVLAMFHDQGNIAAKLLDFGAGVTYIHGLPVIRTSVAHGTAYDIAGTGIASEETLVQAVLTACDLAEKRERKNG